MISSKSWHVKNGVLYQPKNVLYDFLWLGFMILAVIFIFLRSTINYLILINDLIILLYLYILIFQPALKLFQKIKNFGWLGEPIIAIKKDNICINEKYFIPSLRKSININIYDDEIHLVGVPKSRFIRFVNKKTR